MTDQQQRLRGCQVLVVEDDVAIQQLLIGHFLELIGITDITYAENGIDGLAAARRILPDLIILDIEMPRMNGLEMLKHLRADPLFVDIPVIIQTAEESSSRREQMFELGATDFVLKPLSCKEFHGRVRVHLENLLHLRRLQADLSRIEQELQDAAGLQRALLPAPEQLETLERNYRLQISHLFEPSSQLGGDFWGLMPINDQAMGVFICDFAGHGVGAAMNTFQLHTMLDRLPDPDPADPASFVASVNEGLYKVLHHRHYATFLFAVIDVGANLVRYAGAAAPNPFIGQRGGAAVQLLDGSGIPLGLASQALFDNHEVAFPPGSFLFLYSDALSEQLFIGDKMLGEEGIHRLVSVTAQQPRGASPIDSLLAQAPRRGGATLADDLTAVWIERV